MGLVNGYQPYRHAVEQSASALELESLRCKVKEVKFTATTGDHNVLPVRRVQRAGKVCSADPELPGSRNLILHQRNQRRDHNSHTWTQQGRKLITKGFTTTGGHDKKGIAPVYHMLDDCFLRWAKLVEPEGARKNLARGKCRRAHPFSR